MKKFSALGLLFKVINYNGKRVVTCDGIIIYTLEPLMASWNVTSIREYLLARFNARSISGDSVIKFIEDVRKNNYAPNMVG